jgi:hypothetical protein
MDTHIGCNERNIYYANHIFGCVLQECCGLLERGWRFFANAGPVIQYFDVYQYASFGFRKFLYGVVL